MGLDGRIAIVTGGGRGIGRAICHALSREGASLVLAEREDRLGRATADELATLGRKVIFQKTDVSIQEQVAELVALALDHFNGIHILVNNAGVHDQAPFWEEPVSMWERMYRVNVIGTVLVSQLVVRHMKDHGGGAIVNIASKAGVVGEPGHAAYSASKGAVISLTRAMAIELAPFGIRVNAVCPGPTETDMLMAAVPDPEGRRTLATTAPLGRLGTPEDIAAAVLYLASPESAWTTGQALSVDGGLSVLK